MGLEASSISELFLQIFQSSDQQIKIRWVFQGKSLSPGHWNTGRVSNSFELFSASHQKLKERWDTVFPGHLLGARSPHQHTPILGGGGGEMGCWRLCKAKLKACNSVSIALHNHRYKELLNKVWKVMKAERRTCEQGFLLGGSEKSLSIKDQGRQELVQL